MGRRERKKEKSKKIWMSILIVFLMTFSIFAVIIGSPSNDMKFGKYKFKIEDNQYVTKINGTEKDFYTLPYETLYINLSDDTVNKIKNAYFIMVAFDPADEQNLPIIELARFDFARLISDKMIYGGVLDYSEDYVNLPLLSCANATAQTPVIVFNNSATISITDIDSCIYLNGRGYDFIRLRDRLVYAYYGVDKEIKQES